MAVHDTELGHFEFPDGLWVTNFVTRENASPESVILGIMALETSLRAMQRTLGVSESPMDFQESKD